eukprot:NODE_941_length_2903_cov_0.299572.p2 type:complete len:103 gc:universal NODE_941_length_2903_cov_0.299572:1024-716(-)
MYIPSSIWYRRSSYFFTDKLGKHTSKKKLQKIKNRKKKIARLYQRIEDPTSRMHYEAIRSLRKCPVILLPEFAAQGMTKNLPGNQKRGAVSWTTCFQKETVV